MVPVDKRMVFAVGDLGRNGEQALLLGIPAAVWDEIKGGAISHDLDLTVLGIPLKLVLFGGADHSACLKVIEEAARKHGVPLLDERRKDFSIKGNKR